MKTMGQIAKDWRLGRKLLPEDVAKLVSRVRGKPTTRQDIAGFESGKVNEPRYLPALARVMGYASTDDLRALRDPPSLSGSLGEPTPAMVEGGFSGTPSSVTGAYFATEVTLQGVRVVGVAKVGEGAFFEESREGHVEGVVPGSGEYPNAYALLVIGDGWRPVIKPGQYVVVWPKAPYDEDSAVVITFKDGRQAVENFDRMGPGEFVTFTPLNGVGQHTVNGLEIESIDPVMSVAQAGSFRAVRPAGSAQDESAAATKPEWAYRHRTEDKTYRRGNLGSFDPEQTNKQGVK